MELLIVHTGPFKQIQAIQPLTDNETERRQRKFTILDQIKSKVKRRWGKAVKLTRVLDEIIYKATDRGYSFNGRETLAKICECSLSTVDEALRVLRESGEVIIGYRENPNSNGYKTPIVFFKNHPHFKYWNDLLGLDKYVKQEVNQEVENEERPCESRTEGPKNISTNLLPSLKQENNNISNQEKLLKKYADYKIQDIIKKGVTVKYISRYINKLFKSLENQSLDYANELDKARRKKQQEQASKWFKEANGIKEEPAPFYNWLKS